MAVDIVIGVIIVLVIILFIFCTTECKLNCCRRRSNCCRRRPNCCKRIGDNGATRSTNTARRGHGGSPNGDIMATTNLDRAGNGEINDNLQLMDEHDEQRRLFVLTNVIHKVRFSFVLLLFILHFTIPFYHVEGSSKAVASIFLQFQFLRTAGGIKCVTA